MSKNKIKSCFLYTLMMLCACVSFFTAQWADFFTTVFGVWALAVSGVTFIGAVTCATGAVTFNIECIDEGGCAVPEKPAPEPKRGRY